MINILVISLLASLSGCGSESITSQNTADDTEPAQDAESSQQDQDAEETEENSSAVTELYVQFGADGETFVLHLCDNDTAAAIANYVGTTTWQLPIYHYDDFEDWEVMQYYDIPSRYEIPDNAESITSEQGGTVYYSDPNRLVLFYQDAEVSGDYGDAESNGENQRLWRVQLFPGFSAENNRRDEGHEKSHAFFTGDGNSIDACRMCLESGYVRNG